MDDETGLTARVLDRLDRRLSHRAPGPVALALSGGGDSVALLSLAAAWAKTRGRALLALTVDHRLNPASADWTAFAGEAARAAGAEWRGLSWIGDKPITGLTAAARTARHRLIAEAARQAGARVILLAHTADDVAETEWMRAQGSTLGRLRDWSPSPVWPEGRGLMLFRPLLGERRVDLRCWLERQGARWIEDPANDDPRFGRARARRALADKAPVDTPPLPTREPRPSASPGVRALGRGMVLAERDVTARGLAAALVCVGGGSALPRLDRLQALLDRLRARETFVAALAGARVQAHGGSALLMREPGELIRRGVAPLPLPVGKPVVWDGRFEFVARRSGWRVEAARGRMAALSAQDRDLLNSLPPAARAATPVLCRDGQMAPVLAESTVKRRDLVPQRLSLALDETTHEDDLNHAEDGVTPSNALFSSSEHPDRPSNPDLRTTEDLNEPA